MSYPVENFLALLEWDGFCSSYRERSDLISVVHRKGKVQYHSSRDWGSMLQLDASLARPRRCFFALRSGKRSGLCLVRRLFAFSFCMSVQPPVPSGCNLHVCVLVVRLEQSLQSRSSIIRFCLAVGEYVFFPKRVPWHQHSNSPLEAASVMLYLASLPHNPWYHIAKSDKNESALRQNYKAAFLQIRTDRRQRFPRKKGK